MPLTSTVYVFNDLLKEVIEWEIKQSSRYGNNKIDIVFLFYFSIYYKTVSIKMKHILFTSPIDGHFRNNDMTPKYFFYF